MPLKLHALCESLPPDEPHGFLAPLKDNPVSFAGEFKLLYDRMKQLL